MTALTLRCFLVAVCLAARAQSAAPIGKPVLDVDAGDQDRRDSIVSLPLPKGLQGAYWLRGRDGQRLPLQVDGEGQGWFIVPKLKAKEQRRYWVDLEKKPARGRPDCELDFEEGALLFSYKRRLVVQFNQTPTYPPNEETSTVYRRGGYLHPLYSPGGLKVTDDYPTNHLHQHGLWSAWTRTRFEERSPDFWNMGTSKGTVVPLALDEFWEGPVHAGFVARNRYVDLLAKPRRIALDETWTSRVFAVGGGKPAYRVLDIHILQIAHSSSPLEILEYHYGGFGIRGHESWNAKTNMAVLTSEGVTDRLKAHGMKIRWLAVSGTVDRGNAGMAILCHPSSFRAPQPVRVHPDEPFFCFAPPQSGPFFITQNQPYQASYRIVTFDGVPHAILLERLWKDYASPAKVSLNIEPATQGSR